MCVCVHACVCVQSSSTGQGDEELPERLSQLLSQLGEGEGGEGEEGEEGLVKMMEGMMGTLLSRDVLYPSLTEICKQVHTRTVRYMYGYCPDSLCSRSVDNAVPVLHTFLLLFLVEKPFV